MEDIPQYNSFQIKYRQSQKIQYVLISLLIILLIALIITGVQFSRDTTSQKIDGIEEPLIPYQTFQ